MKDQILFQNPVSIIKAKNPSQDIHWHENFEVIMVLKGLLNLQIGFEKFTLSEGDIMIVNSLESHSVTSLKRDTEVLFVSLDKESCLKINPFFYESIAIVDYSVGFVQLQENQEKVTKSIVALLKSLPHEDFHGGIDKIWLQIVHERMTDLLNLFSAVYKPKILKGGVLVVAPEEKINMLYRMINYLYKNYNKTPSLDDLLKKEHYSLYHMSHVILEITGTSFREWLTYVRVEQSEKILLSGDSPISSVAYEVGFSSVRYYNANFKKWYGMTPADFRRLFKRDHDESFQTPSGDLIMARSFLYDYLENHTEHPPQHVSDHRQEDTDENTLFIEMKSETDSGALVAYPQQQCAMHLNELSNFDRWKHLLWVKDEIGINTLRVLVPAGISDSGLPDREADRIEQMLAYIRKNHKASHESEELKILLETAATETHINKPFELLNPYLPLGELVTGEGFKTPAFFFYSLLSRFKHKKVSVMPQSIVARSENRIFVFITHRGVLSSDHNQSADFKIHIKGICGDYKLAIYKCDLRFFHNHVPVKDANVLPHLTSYDYKCLNKMHEPEVTFELISFQNDGEIKLRLTENSCQLLVFTPVNV